MRLFPRRYLQGLSFTRHDLHNILDSTIQRSAYFQKDLRRDMPVTPHLGNGCRADASLCAEVLFLHILINEQLPELFVTHRHTFSSRYYKNALPLGRAYGLYGYPAKALQHLTVLFIMIAYSVKTSKKIIHSHDF